MITNYAFSTKYAKGQWKKSGRKVEAVPKPGRKSECSDFYRRHYPTDYKENCEIRIQDSYPIRLQVSNDLGAVITSGPAVLYNLGQPEPSNPTEGTPDEALVNFAEFSVHYKPEAGELLSQYNRTDLESNTKKILDLFYDYVDLILSVRHQTQPQRLVAIKAFFSETRVADFNAARNKINEVLSQAELMDIISTHLKIKGAHEYVRYFELEAIKQPVLDQTIDIKLK